MGTEEKNLSNRIWSKLLSELVGYVKCYAGGEEPEAGSAQFVEEGEGALVLLYFGDGDFVGDAVTLDYAEGVGQFAIAELDALVTNVDGVTGAVDEFVLVHIDAVELIVADVNSVMSDVGYHLRYHLRAPAPDEGAESSEEEGEEDDLLDEWPVDGFRANSPFTTCRLLCRPQYNASSRSLQQVLPDYIAPQIREASPPLE